MSMVLQTAPRTRAELLALPDDGCRHELIDGEHIVTPAPAWLHQQVVLRLLRQLDAHLLRHQVGALSMSPADVVLGEDEVLQPDIFVVAAEPNTIQHWRDITALSLVIEVVSPSSARTDRERKRIRYQRAGVPFYWIVDPGLRQVEVWQPDSIEGAVVRGTLTWPVPAEAPLAIDLATLFPQ